MKLLRFSALLICLSASPSFANEAARALARSYLTKAIAAMGGSELLSNVKTLRIESRGHVYILDESEWSDGPWSVSYEHSVEFRDYARQALKVDKEHSVLISPEVERTILTVVGDVAQTTRNGKTFAASIFSGEPDEAKESLAFVPERLLPAALASPDLNAQADTTLHGVRYHVVSVTYLGLPTRIFINADSGFLGVVEWTNSYPNSVFWKPWGDVANRAEFSVYSLLPGGLRFPMQRDYERNGQPYRSESIFKIEVNPSFPQDSFAIDPKVQQAVSQRHGPVMPGLGKAAPIIEGDDSLVQYIGDFNCAIVKQSDGLVLIEAPVDSHFTEELIAEANRRYAHAPIKALISTSGAWAHVGGLQDVVERGIPVYATDVNKALLTRLIKAGSPRVGKKAGREPEFHWVSQKVSLGSGPNQLQIYPVRNASGEGSLMIYLPMRKLLYSSDLVQPGEDGTFFWPEYLREMTDAVSREHLAVDKFFGMHAPVTSWSSVVNFLDRAQERPR